MAINQHKRMAMGEKVTGMAKGGVVMPPAPMKTVKGAKVSGTLNNVRLAKGGKAKC